MDSSRSRSVTRFVAASTLLFGLAACMGKAAPSQPAEMRGQDRLQQLVNDAHAKFKDEASGKNADYIPYLATVPSELFGVCIVTTDGRVFSAGDVNYAFSIQSCAKVFTLCQALQEAGDRAVQEKIGVEPSGLPFNSITALGLHTKKPLNPLINAGAIATVSLIQAAGPGDRWDKILAYQSRFAGEKLQLIDEVYKSEAATNWNNRGIANILFNRKLLYCDPMEAVDVYTKECSIGVTARQLCVMGATLANGGVNPITEERCLDAKYVPRVLAVMMSCGFYDESGEWAYSTGLPGKTGVGGGIVTVVPGKMAIVGFSPRLNEAGNSIRAMKATNYIAQDLGLNLFGAKK